MSETSYWDRQTDRQRETDRQTDREQYENLLVDQFPQSIHGVRMVCYRQFCISKSLLIRWRKAKFAGPMCLVSEVVKVAGEV